MQKYDENALYLFFLHLINKDEAWQKDSTVEKALILHMTDPYSMPSTTYGPLITVMNDTIAQAKSKLWPQLSMASNQKQITKKEQRGGTLWWHLNTDNILQV